MESSILASLIVVPNANGVYKPVFHVEYFGSMLRNIYPDFATMQLLKLENNSVDLTLLLNLWKFENSDLTFLI